MDKVFLRKLYLFIAIVGGLFLLMPSSAIASTNTIQMEHKTNVPVDKVWKIKFNQSLSEVNLIKGVEVYDTYGVKAQTKISYDSVNNQILVQPPALGYKYSQTYSLHIYETIKSLNNNPLKSYVSMNFTTEAFNQIPKINTIDIDHLPLVEGDSARFYIASKESNKVQYRVYLTNQQLNTTKELTKGYSAVMEGTSPFYIDSSEAFNSGGYGLKVYVKRANVDGIKSDNNTDYDDFKVFEFQCLTKTGSSENYSDKNIITDATRYKIGQAININQGGTQATSSTSTLKAYKLLSEGQPQDLTNKTTWTPSEVGTYKLEANTKSLNESTGEYLISTKIKYIEVSNKEYIYQQYNRTLDEIVDIQFNCSTKQLNYLSSKYFSVASKQDLKEYINPKKIEEDDNAIYQFLTLNYIEGVTAEELNGFLKGRGVLDNQGIAFLKAAKDNNINVAYLIAHAVIETGHGKSVLSNGVEVSEVDGKAVVKKTAYNMFGIGAVDKNALKFGSERAYKEGWFSVESAIIGGAKFISTSYINNNTRKQNTLYKMRWNPANPATYQYATDIGWAYKQIKYMKEILDKCKNAYLVFEIPQYK